MLAHERFALARKARYAHAMAGSRRGPPYGGDVSTINYVKRKDRLALCLIKEKDEQRLYFKKVKQRGLSLNKNKRIIWLLVLKKEKVKALVLKRLKEKGGLKFKRMIKGVY